MEWMSRQLINNSDVNYVALVATSTFLKSPLHTKYMHRDNENMNERMDDIEDFRKRIKQRTVEESLEIVSHEIIDKCKSVVVFTNGISRYAYLRLLALHILGRMDYDWRKACGFLKASEVEAVEEDIEEWIDSDTFSFVTIVSDARWEKCEISREVARELKNASVVLVLNRQRQWELNFIVGIIEDGASAAGIVMALEFLNGMHKRESDRVYCNEYQGVDVAMRTILQPNVIKQLLKSSPEVRLFTHYLLGITRKINFNTLVASAA